MTNDIAAGHSSNSYDVGSEKRVTKVILNIGL